MGKAYDKNKVRELFLVLGGNGFVGSHIVDGLLAKNKRVRVLDSFRHKAQFYAPETVEKISGDAFNLKTLTKALEGVTHVVYSLSATNPFTSDADPYADIDGLHKGVEILEACVQAGVKKFGFISSGGAVYGRLAERKMAHEEDVALPLSPYGICKLAMEHYLEYFNKKYDLEYVVFRLSNPYGPRQVFKNGQGVVVAFMQRIADGEEITVYGDGSASRDYIYAEDAGHMIARSMTRPNKHNIYNVGSGQLVTLQQIVHALEKNLGKKASLVFIPATKTSLEKTGLDVSRFYNEFSPTEPITFEAGIAETAKCFLVRPSGDD